VKRSFRCPRCNAALNPGTKVVFVAEHGEARGLVLLSPELGNYRVVCDESFPLAPGAKYLFRCPSCRAELTSPQNHNLVEILLRDERGTTARITFSRICGEHATFMHTTQGVRRFGEHAERYVPVNFFGAGESESG
jgi:hypothetical protein